MAKYISVVFLDLDGVLNSSKHLKSIKSDDTPNPVEFEFACDLEPLFEIPCHRSVILNSILSIDAKAVKVLNEILAKSGAKVVVSSSWRYSHPLEVLRRMLEFRGFQGELIDMTATDLDRWGNTCRGHEIQDWMDRNPVDHFVILDDDEDMDYLKDHLVRTAYAEGLTSEHIEAILRVLSLP
jgi:hypothetical protein